ncbi:SPOR domain-containing protein [Corticibacter populi]|uniref:SPOR domain-containing protein n=1 Tax=Corticibacter populi TaxID=1550736 RepID=A0A3M6QYA5_9BURK|nr:SPOR domain-containing protein [Corticibacter populi]RMX08006.1 SPOR domain-containing protein [Corticibacter populi]RZS35249.1 DedD protein [Corticibacter populi]
MALFESRKKAEPAEETGSRNSGRRRSAAGSVDDMRRRARHRLIGACLLVLAAIVVFPMLFDTQPRPVAVNAEVSIPGVDSAPPLALPASSAANNAASGDVHGLGEGEEVVALAAPSASPGSAAQPQAPNAASATAPTAAQRAAEAARRPEATAPGNARTPPAGQNANQGNNPPAAQPPAAQPGSRPSAASQAATPEPPPAAKPPPPVQPPPAQPPASVRADEAARARALLEGKPVETVVPSRSEEGRFIVQVGAFSDDAKVREVRSKLDQLGLKTYTQVVQTGAGRATRVRVGPFGSRAEANQAAERVKAANLPAAIMSL